MNPAVPDKTAGGMTTVYHIGLRHISKTDPSSSTAQRTLLHAMPEIIGNERAKSLSAICWRLSHYSPE